MKKRIFQKREKGAVALIAVFAMVLFLTLLALVVDGGLLYYKAAKLQNAVDASVVAVAQNIDATDYSETDVARNYLKANGFDWSEFGDDMKITIEKKGFLKNTAAAEEYISTGYIKMTVKIKDNTLLGSLSGVDSLKLEKSGYAKCDVNYIAMPTALKYTIFGGSINQTDLPKDMTVQINGRASDSLTQITKIFEDSINGINSAIIQPIIGIFGGTPDYGKLVNINLSEAITNGDVYSNSDINIGMQAINVSRTKDEYWAKEKDGEGNSVDAIDEENVWEYNDYGQVTYSAVGKINFSNIAGDSTHVYVQNQQYLEQTQVALQVLNRLNLSTISDTDTLKLKYEEEANNYINKYGVTMPSQKTAIINQKDNLAKNPDGTISLNNQSMIIYNISNATANALLTNLRNGTTTGAALLEKVTTYGIDDLLNADKSALMYASYGDKPSSTSYTVTLNKDGTIKNANVAISQANRDIHIITQNGRLSNKSVSGYEFAVAKTFKQNSDYVSIPNMKPYFIRQIYKAVANATTSKQDAQNGIVNGKTTVKNAVVDMSLELGALIQGMNNYSTNSKGEAVSVFDDQQYSAEGTLTNKSTSPLFRYNYDGTNLIKYETDGDGHIKFNGENLYDANDVLKNAKPFINDFSIDSYANAIDVFENENITGKIANDAVIDAKNDFKKEKSYDAFNKEVNETTFYKKSADDTKFDAPNDKDVFLSSVWAGAPYNRFIEKTTVNPSDYSEYSTGGELEKTSVSIEEPSPIPDDKTFTTVTLPSIPSKEITVWGNTYKLEELVTKVKPINQVVDEVQGAISTQIGAWNDYTGQDPDGLKRCSNEGKYTTDWFGNETGNYHRPGKPESVINPYQNQYYTGGRPFYVPNDSQVYYTDYMTTGNNDGRGLYMRNKSTLIIGGNNVDSSSYALNAGNKADLNDGATLIVNGNAYINGQLIVGSSSTGCGSIVIVNGNLQVNGGINVRGGSTLIVTGNLIGSNGVTVNEGAGENTNVYVGGYVDYADSSPDGTIGGRTNSSTNSSYLQNGTTFVVLNNNDDNTSTYINFSLHIEKGANFYSQGTIRVYNKNDGESRGEGFVVEDGATAFVHNLQYYDNQSLFVSAQGSGKLYSDGKISCTSFKLVDKETSGVLEATPEVCIGDLDSANTVTIGVHQKLQIKSINSATKFENYGNLVFTSNAVVGEITNNGNIFGTTISGTVLTNNYNGFVQLTEDLKFTYITNEGIIKCAGAIIANAGDFKQQTQDTAFTVAKSLTATNIYISRGKVLIDDGNVTATYLQIGPTNSTLYIKSGSLTVTNLDAYNNSYIYVGNNMAVTGTALLQNTEIKVENTLAIETISIQGGCTPKVDYGSFGSAVIEIAAGEKIKLTGNYESVHVINKGSLYITSSTVLGSIYNDDGAEIICDGNLTLQMNNKETGHESESLTNYGDVYVNGNLTSYGSVLTEGGKLYIRGDLKAATYSSNNRVITVGGENNEIYISGWISSSSNGEVVIKEDATNTIFSVYGYHGLYYTAFDYSTVTCFENNSTGSTAYLGTGSADTTTYIHKVIVNNSFKNSGKVFVYGSLKLGGSIDLSGNSSSKTISRFNIDAGNNWISIEKGHILKAYETLSCGGIQLNGPSEIYGIKNLNISRTDLNTWDEGVLFYGPESNIKNNSAFTFNCRENYKAKIYIPADSKTISVTFKNSSTGKPANFDGGKFVTNANVKLIDSYELNNSAVLYVGGIATLGNNHIKNNAGELYLIDGVSRTATDDFLFNSGCTNFIGPVNATSTGDYVLGTLSTANYLNASGKNYIQNSLTIKGRYPGSNNDYIPNRGEAIIISAGETHFSGDINCSGSSGNGIYTQNGTKLTCNSLSITSSIYNMGDLLIKNNLNYINNEYYSDKNADATSSDLKFGYSIRNGIDKNGNKYDAKMYVGGTSPVTIGGAVQNYGELFSNAKFTINGYNIPEYNIRFNTGESGTSRYARKAGKNGDYAPHLSIEAGESAKSYFSKGLSTSGVVYSQKDSLLFCDGDLLYGMALLNGGDFIVTGKVDYSDNHYGINHIEVFENVALVGDNPKGSFSIVNGFIQSGESAADQNRDAVMYIGFKKKQADGTYVDMAERNLVLGVDGQGKNIQSGSVMNWGDMYVNASLTVNVNKELAYNITGFISQQGAKTFISGSYRNTAAAMIVKGSMFMCDGDYLTRRCTKIGISESINNSDDKDSQTYVYVGGNMNANEGLDGGAIDKSTYSNSSSDFDLFSNTNLYVKGKLDCSQCIVCTKQNVVVAVDGNGVASDDNAFVTKQYDQKSNASQFNRLVVRGNATVFGTTKFRDMCKAYIYGDFYSGKYVEIGKALDGKDDTEAMEAPFFNEDVDKHDNQVGYDYKFENAGEFFVKGNFTTGGYTRLYAGTTLRVGQNYRSSSFLTLRHDANIYVGKDAISGKSIDGGSFSDFYIGGALKASQSTIKIRDNSNLFVGADMTALSYIELGKAGDYTREIITTEVIEGEDGGGDNDAYTGNGSEEATDETENNAVNTSNELLADTSDSANGCKMFIGKSLVSYTGYIKEFAFSRVVVGNYVFTPKYLTLRHNADLWVMPETFNNTTYKHIAYVSQSDGTLIGDIIDKLNELAFNIKDKMSLKTGSIYTLGELTLNRNASLMGTYDAIAFGQCVLRPDTLIYMGHDFKCSANSVNLSFDSIKGDTSVVGFDTYGEVQTSGNVTSAYPVVVYANNDINITTTTDMKLTYLIANNGDVKLYDVYSKSNNANGNLNQLPNAICSLNGDVDYFAMYGKISALFYAPIGTVDLDGYYQDIWGCCIGDKVKINTFYLSLHRFTNWNTMNLQVAESGSTYLISEKEYNNVVSNVDEKLLYITSREDEVAGGANIFFPGKPGDFYDSIISGTEIGKNDMTDPLDPPTP